MKQLWLWMRRLPGIRNITRKNWAIAALAVFILGSGLFVGVRAGVRAVSGEKRELPIYSVQRDDKVIAISFDAAWGDEDTEQILAALAEYDVKTTFFVVGSWVDKYPHQVKALADAGHEIMNHSNSHPHMSTLSRDKIQAEISACNDKIEAITNVRPHLFRPPYGDYNNAVIQTLRNMDMFTVQWDVDSLDWKDLTAAQIHERVVPKVSPGSIVLFHNGAKNTANALPEILKGLLDKGYAIVKVSEIIHYDNFEIDHTGRQIPKTPLS